ICFPDFSTQRPALSRVSIALAAPRANFDLGRTSVKQSRLSRPSLFSLATPQGSSSPSSDALLMSRSHVERETEGLRPPTDALASHAVGLSEARYRTLIQAISQIVWTRSPAGEFVERQTAWEEFTGQSQDEYLGWGWLEVVHEDDRLRVKQNWRRAVEAAAPYHAEYRLRSRDGVYRWVAVRAAPVLEPDGTVREWIGTHSDIDAAKRAYEERARLFESERSARREAERAMNRLRSAWSVAD